MMHTCTHEAARGYAPACRSRWGTVPSCASHVPSVCRNIRRFIHTYRSFQSFTLPSKHARIGFS
eukprot:2397529-Prymnesium_polylepis.1